jgi:hypothetical protein
VRAVIFLEFVHFVQLGWARWWHRLLACEASALRGRGLGFYTADAAAAFLLIPFPEIWPYYDREADALYLNSKRPSIAS